MANIKVPYFVEKRGRDGPRYFWQPSKNLRSAGWYPRRLPIAEGDALQEARRLNDELAKWRKGEQTDEMAPATGGRRKIKPGSIDHLILLFKQSRRWAKLALATQRSYRQCLTKLSDWCGDVPMINLRRGQVQDWYEQNYERTPAFTNAVMRVGRTLFKFGLDKEKIRVNPFEKPGLIGTAPRLRIWSPEEIDAQVAAGDALGRPSIGDAVLMGYYFGQRQGDVIHMPWLRYQAANGIWRIKIRQSKTGAWIDIPAAPRLAARLDAARARNQQRAKPAATIVVSEATGAPYKSDDFRHVFADVRALAEKGSNELGLAPCPSIADAWYLDLRDTAVTTLAEADCTIPQICAITGHSEKSAYSILKHYLATNGEMASQAIAKLIAYEERRKAQAEAATQAGSDGQ